MPERIAAVFFDAGGTLIRPHRTVGEIYATIAARHGLDLPAAVLEERFHSVFPNMPPLCFRGVPPSALTGLERRWWRWLVEQVFGDCQINDFNAFFAEVFDYFADGAAWQVFPEVVETLEVLKSRGVRTAIVSNFDARLLRLCDELGLSRRVHTVIASTRVGFAKPDPRIFQAGLRRLGVQASQALHVGDSEREDVQGARAAALRPILIRREACGDEPQPDVIADLRQILSWC